MRNAEIMPGRSAGARARRLTSVTSWAGVLELRMCSKAAVNAREPKAEAAFIGSRAARQRSRASQHGKQNSAINHRFAPDVRAIRHTNGNRLRMIC